MSDRASVPDNLVAPGIRDERSIAFAKLVNEALGAIDPARFFLRDAWTVDAKLLPALAVQYSLGEFMVPGLPETVVRRFIAGSFQLHEQKGTVAGVRFGLSLLGMTVEWKQWFRQEPPGEPNTHVVTVYVNEHLFPESEAILNPAAQRAAQRMIDATKRWSQDVAFRLGAGWESTIGAASLIRSAVWDRRTIAAGPQTGLRGTTGVAQAATGLAILRRAIDAGPQTRIGRPLAAASAAHALQIHRMNFTGAA